MTEKQKLNEKLYKCPFCGEDGFDLIGLKYHLENYCQGYKDTLTIDSESKGGKK